MASTSQTDIHVQREGTTLAGAPAARIELVGGALRRISWGAVFAGLFIVLAVELLLAMLGLGVGLSIVNPGQGNTPNASSFGIGAGIWWGVSYLIALFAGGYVAARSTGQLTSWEGALHGLLTWAFTSVVTFYLLSTAVGSAIGGAFSAVGTTLSATGQTLSSAVPEVARAAGVTPDRLQQTAKDLLSGPTNADPNTMSPEQAVQEVAANLPKLALGGDQARAARDRIVAIMSARLKITPEDANSRLDQLQGQIQQATRQLTSSARQAADVAATSVSRAAFAAFVALILGALAAAWGGQIGATRRDRLAVNP